MSNHRRRITIIGAGLAGISIAKEIRLKGVFGRVLAFLDDDPAKIGKKINGIPILGPIDAVVKLLKPSTDDEALIAIPSGKRDQLQRIHRLLREAGFSKIRILPGLSQILFGDAHFIQTREINPEDFLSRDSVKVPLKESLAYVRGKRVLVTGAGGSIGSELSRQLLNGGAERLYLFGHGENSIYAIERDLRLLQEAGIGERATIVPVIGELKDSDYMFHILQRLKADVTFHAAAYKHVPMGEANPVATLKNNVFGTKNLLDASVEGGVKQFVMISTDKAVNPSNIYGASKFLAEELVLRERKKGRQYIVVRFGNVLGSRGSILPLFTNQILKGGPVTITDPRASRFFITNPEATTLLHKAGGIQLDADMLLLDMGEPLNIKEMVEQMIIFYGFQPEKDIKFIYTGLRPGEKLTERLWSSKEHPEKTEYHKILRLRRTGMLDGKLDDLMSKLKSICYLNQDDPSAFRNRHRLKEVLHDIIPTIEIPKNEPEY